MSSCPTRSDSRVSYPEVSAGPAGHPSSTRIPTLNSNCPWRVKPRVTVTVTVGIIIAILLGLNLNSGPGGPGSSSVAAALHPGARAGAGRPGRTVRLRGRVTSKAATQASDRTVPCQWHRGGHDHDGARASAGPPGAPAPGGPATAAALTASRRQGPSHGVCQPEHGP